MALPYAFVLAMLLANTAHAALVDRGGALIFDSDLNVTWMANASLSATESFGVTGINPTGTMDWITAQAWVNGMNATAYLGFTNWRLPTTLYPDLNCTHLSGGHNCIGSDMGHLYYEELGGTANTGIDTTHNLSYLLFDGIQANQYWTNTGFAQSGSGAIDNAWTFYFYGGVQQTLAIENYAAVWAVRDGDVTAVPEPSACILMLTGLGLLGWMARTKGTKQYVADYS